MTTKKMSLVSLVFLALLLSACSSQAKKATTKPSLEVNQSWITKPSVPNHEDVRMKFEQIRLGTEANEFQGGSNLEELKALFGEPSGHETKQAGENVTIDAYTWTFDDVVLAVQQYKDSAISRSISNFQFTREERITLDDYKALTEGMTFEQVVEKFGKPDVMAQVVSTGKAETQAIWSSGLKKGANVSNANIQLIFEQGVLTKKSQNGLG
ncbi:DUF3862 domain-containing protein [Streptococcus cuniculipharyngis]|uniref:DUF3862 domain-containing protein n=1 Tax=Streptococcus cuniculipharyngis TaxID=1562651 RepID=A0A5C5SAV8_9STRE|nr:DUF3862 domain-containing protein [Streptococcus cuniculipharyngis]TWS96899.1 DUF3862 domain-containing protein [Streptococcus cuniculipharyngis]